MIVDLYAGGMTVRDIGFHLKNAFGVPLITTISKITDGILEEVKAWQTRHPILYIDALVVKGCADERARNKAAPTSWSASTPTASNMCSGSGCKPPKARNSGSVCSPSCATAECVTF